MRDSLGDRMKANYESRAQTSLLRRTPVIVRVDGKAFHTFTAGMEKPFDQYLINTMKRAAEAVAKELQGCKVAYLQSDEVSFLLTDFDDLNTDAWFDYNVQKLASVTASLMTGYFAQAWLPLREALLRQDSKQRLATLAFFDARAFNLPKEEVANYFLWRVRDWERNSLTMFARSLFSQKQLHGKNKAQIHEMLHKQKVNWASLPDAWKNGTFLLRAKGNDFKTTTRVKPSYADVNAILKPYLESDDGNEIHDLSE